MDIPQWIKDFIAGTIKATPEIVAAFRQWSMMQNPVTLVYKYWYKLFRVKI